MGDIIPYDAGEVFQGADKVNGCVIGLVNFEMFVII